MRQNSKTIVGKHFYLSLFLGIVKWITLATCGIGQWRCCPVPISSGSNTHTWRKCSLTYPAPEWLGNVLVFTVVKYCVTKTKNTGLCWSILFYYWLAITCYCYLLYSMVYSACISSPIFLPYNLKCKKNSESYCFQLFIYKSSIFNEYALHRYLNVGWNGSHLSRAGRHT